MKDAIPIKCNSCRQTVLQMTTVRQRSRRMGEFWIKRKYPVTPSLDLLMRYNVPVPRYTSYPTVPAWQDHLDPGTWKSAFTRDFHLYNGLSGLALYLHLPFCEKLCTYCGCNKKITTNHDVEDGYIAAIHNEWKIYRSWMRETPVIRELHLGGGTPTFFSPANLTRLLQPILQDAIIHPQHEFSFEGHPNNTTEAHLETLYNAGFRRVSFGVQDNDPEVQRIINRIQPFQNVQRVTAAARRIGYKSVNFDLIYGLPRQTKESITQTISEVISLKPDRVAFYSYAHVPWTSRGQRLFDEHDLPSAAEKLALYQAGKALFLDSGYVDIGMDHFALPADDLAIAQRHGRLHRNFMGYTTQQTELLLGLGVSSISSTPAIFAQNEKTIHDYYSAVNSGQPAVIKGYMLTDEDRRFARYIRDISCNGRTKFNKQDIPTIQRCCMPELRSLEAYELILLSDDGIVVTPMGRNFTRNICSALDLHLIKTKAGKDKPSFSKAI